MSLLTIILAVGAALVVAAQLVLAAWYKRWTGTLLRPSARTKLKGNVPVDQVVIVSAFVIAGLVGLAVPVFWPDSAFAQWMREPYATTVYFVWCFAGMLVLNFTRAVGTVLLQRQEK